MTRKTEAKMLFRAVTGSKKPFRDIYDGHIGIGPWQSEKTESDDNFMRQLKAQGVVDHMVLQLNFGTPTHPNGYAKFGSWDSNALAEGSSLTVLKTPSQDAWALATQHVQLDGKVLSQFESEIYFTPELPYLYLPKDEFEYFAYLLRRKFRKSKIGVTCTADFCQF